MDSSSNSELAGKIVSIISFSFGFCCVLLCCGGYILSKKQNKQNQIQLIHHQHDPAIHAPIFTIDMHDTQSMDMDINNLSYHYHSDTLPPPYETKEEVLLQDESITQISPTEQMS